MIVIVDYGLGNLASVKNMIKKVGGRSIISSDPDEISSAEKLVLPGVGSFGTGMANIKERGIDEALKIAVVENKVPLLGICLGAQLLTRHSEEQDTTGLGFIPAQTRRFRFEDSHFKVPHMGWNHVNYAYPDHPLVAGIAPQPRYYFVHSYYMQCDDRANSFCTTNYGGVFDAGIIKDNIVGLQFHPEKSHVFGMHVMKNFLSWQNQ